MLTETSPIVQEDLDEHSVKQISEQERDFANLILLVREGDAQAVERLYEMLLEGIRFLLWRRVGTEYANDLAHDTFVAVVRAIREGQLRLPRALLSFTQSVARNLARQHVADKWRTNRSFADVWPRAASNDETPEEQLVYREEGAVVRQVLGNLGPRQREILVRFYFIGESEQSISAKMELSPTQFRLLKSRAKMKFTELAQAELGGQARRSSGRSRVWARSRDRRCVLEIVAKT